jgi:hypothetical protein
MVHPMIIYICKEVIPMKGNDFKTWLVGALTDLGIGIILLILDKLLS